MIISYFSPLFDISGFNFLSKLGSPIMLYLALYYFFVSFRYAQLEIKNLINMTSLIILVIFFSFFSNLDNVKIDSFWEYSYGLLSIPLVIFIFRVAASNERTLAIVFLAFSIGSVANSLFSIYSSIFKVSFAGANVAGSEFIGYNEDLGRVGGMRSENYVGFWNVPGILYFLSLWIKGKYRLLSFCLLAIMYCAVFISFSRTSVLTVIFGTIVMMWFHKWEASKFYLISGFVALGIFLYSAVLFQLDDFTERALQQQESRWQLSTSSAIDRFNPWEYWLNEGVQGNVIFGRGPNYVHSSSRTPGINVPHNSELDVFVDFGALGLIVFISPILIIVQKLVSKKYSNDEYMVLLLVLFLSMFVTLQFLSSPYLKNYWLVYGLILGRLDYIKQNFLVSTD